jgi:hypothetical protein
MPTASVEGLLFWPQEKRNANKAKYAILFIQTRLRLSKQSDYLNSLSLHVM